MSGIELIAKERQEQIEKHGQTIKSDYEYNLEGDLASGAIALIEEEMQFFPAHWDETRCQKMLSKTYIERLTIAAALIAAEIDRCIYRDKLIAERITDGDF